MLAAGPRVIVVDDLHWLDPSSRGLVAEMVALSPGLPLVVLTGTRPPLRPEWADESFVEIIELGGLDEAETEELGTAVGGAELEAESAHWLHQRSAGNPLFIGELMRTLGRSNRIARSGDKLRIDRVAAQRNVPLSLRALLGARIDALPPGPRSAVEVASVIGVVFEEWLLRELAGCQDVTSDLKRLAEEGIVARSEDSGEEDSASGRPGSWRFRHELFHDAAYGRLLTDRKRRLHAALADMLEAAVPPVPAAELARHRLAAGDPSAAIPALERAAAEAESVGAATEAAAFREAIASLSGPRSAADPAAPI
jgi:predicted ATPase